MGEEKTRRSGRNDLARSRSRTTKRIARIIKRQRRKDSEKKEEDSEKQLEAEDAARTHQGMRTLLQHMAGPAGSARSEATFEHEEQDEVSNSNDDSQGGLMQDAAHRTQAPAVLSHRMGLEELAQAARDAAALPEDEGVCVHARMCAHVRACM